MLQVSCRATSTGHCSVLCPELPASSPSSDLAVMLAWSRAAKTELQKTEVKHESGGSEPESHRGVSVIVSQHK